MIFACCFLLVFHPHVRYRVFHSLTTRSFGRSSRATVPTMAGSNNDVGVVEAPVTFKAYLMCAFAAFGGIFFGYDSGYINGVLAMKYFIQEFEDLVRVSLLIRSSPLMAVSPGPCNYTEGPICRPLLEKILDHLHLVCGNVLRCHHRG